MARLSNNDLEAIISRDLPGHKIVHRKPVRSKADAPGTEGRSAVDESSPDIDALRRKYLGSDAEAEGDAVDNSAAADETTASGDDVEDEIVMVEPKQREDPLDHGSRPKAVVVSGKERRIIGYQG